MILRGIRPSGEELSQLARDPGAYPELVQSYLRDPRFLAQVQQWFTEWLELDQAPDVYPAGFPALGDLSGLTSHELNTSIISAAGKLAAQIVKENRPWSELVTTEETMADATVATVWGLDYDYAKGGWQKTAYQDGRPAAGVLSDGWVFTRMPSTEGNRHRERASLIANTFLCHDYPGRPVRIPPDVDLSSPKALTEAISTVPACIGCHHTLDPLASFFSAHHGLRIPSTITAYPLAQYEPQNAKHFGPPVFYGEPGQDLGDLGRLIAADPRFVDCQARRFYAELMHVRVQDIPFETTARLAQRFKQNKLDVRALLTSILLSPEFGHDAPSKGQFRRATPHQLDSMFYELTGYRWNAQIEEDLGAGTVGTVPLMRDFAFGYRTLAGAPNNFDTIEHLRTVDPSTWLTLYNLAQRAARFVTKDKASAQRLLEVPGAFEGKPSAVRAQIVALHLRLYGEVIDANDPQVQAAMTLWNRGQNSSRAWALVLTAMFSHPSILLF